MDLVKEVYEDLGFPLYAAFKHAAAHNHVQNLPITVHKIETYIKTFGPHPAAVKGKTRRSTPKHIPSNDLLPVPPSMLSLHKQVTLCVDIFFVDGLPFLLSVSRNIHFFNVIALPNSRLLSSVFPQLKYIRDLYRFRGFRIMSIHADNQFRPLVRKFLKHGIHMHICPPEGHVPEAKRGIQTVKGHSRSTFASLPFERYPKLLKQYIVTHGGNPPNMQPAKDGVSNTLSPHALITGRAMDYKQHFSLSPGRYCEFNTYHKPANSMKHRSSSGIALGPDPNTPGNFLFLSLDSGKPISRHQWTPMVIDPSVIDRVHALADTERYTPSSSLHTPDLLLFE